MTEEKDKELPQKPLSPMKQALLYGGLGTALLVTIRLVLEAAVLRLHKGNKSFISSVDNREVVGESLSTGTLMAAAGYFIGKEKAKTMTLLWIIQSSEKIMHNW